MNRWRVAALGLVLLLALVGVLALDFYRDSPVAVATTVHPQPIVLERTRERVVRVPEVHTVQVMRPTPKQAHELAETFHLDLQQPHPPSVLGTWELPQMPHGGEAVATLSEAGAVQVVAKASPQPFLEPWGARAFGAGVGLGLPGAQRQVALWARQDLFRAGRVTFTAQAQLNVDTDRQASAVVLLGAELRQ